MHSFAVVSAKPGRAIPEHVRALLRSADLPELAFVPEAHRTWQEPSGRVVVAGWELGAGVSPGGSRWDERPAGVTAVAGHVWCDAAPWPADRSWAAGVAERAQGRALERLAPRLDGAFAVASLAADGRGCLVADPLGLVVVHVAETPDVVVLATRAAVAARLAAPAGQPPARDLEGVGWLVHGSNLADERTPYEGVTALPQGAVVRIDPDDGARVVAPEAPPWTTPGVAPGAADLPTAAAEATERLRAVARTMAALPGRATLELTGGRDSRLVLALLLAEGVADELVCTTWGPRDLPDVQVASALATRLDLDLRAEGHPRRLRPPHGATSGPPPSPAAGGDGESRPPSSSPEVSARDALTHHVWLTSGALNTFDLARVHRRVEGTVSLCGLVGEALRTNHPRTSALGSFDALLADVRDGGFGFDAAGLLRPDARRRYDDRVVERMRSLRPTATTPQDVVDGFFLADRQRRWLAAAHEVETRDRLFPLYSPAAIRAAFAVGSGPRHAQALTFEVMRACNDELARTPFAGKPWPAAAVALAPDPSAYPVQPAAPVPRFPGVRRRASRVVGRWGPARRATHPVRPAPRPPATHVDERRRQEEGAQAELLRELVDLPAGHDLWEVVDRHALDRALAALPDLPFHARRSVHGAVTAAIWASGAEAPVRRIGEG